MGILTSYQKQLLLGILKSFPSQFYAKLSKIQLSDFELLPDKEVVQKNLGEQLYAKFIENKFLEEIGNKVLPTILGIAQLNDMDDPLAINILTSIDQALKTKCQKHASVSKNLTTKELAFFFLLLLNGNIGYEHSLSFKDCTTLNDIENILHPIFKELNQGICKIEGKKWNEPTRFIKLQIGENISMIKAKFPQSIANEQSHYSIMYPLSKNLFDTIKNQIEPHLSQYQELLEIIYHKIIKIRGKLTYFRVFGYINNIVEGITAIGIKKFNWSEL